MNYEKISATLKFLRTQKCMTQNQLAEKLNLTEQAISKWERAIGLRNTVGLIAAKGKDEYLRNG